MGQPPSSEGACHPTVIEASVAEMKNGFGKPYGGIQTINSFSGLLRLSPLKLIVVTANAYLYPVKRPVTL